MVQTLKEAVHCPSQIIPKNDREQIRIKQKGNSAEIRLWTRGKMGLWKPTAHAMKVDMKRIFELETNFKEIAKTYPTLKDLVEKLNKYGVEIPQGIQAVAETMTKAIETVKTAYEEEVAIFEMQSLQAILKLKEVRI